MTELVFLLVWGGMFFLGAMLGTMWGWGARKKAEPKILWPELSHWQLVLNQGPTGSHDEARARIDTLEVAIRLLETDGHLHGFEPREAAPVDA